jgi:hypothetical protein
VRRADFGKEQRDLGAVSNWKCTVKGPRVIVMGKLMGKKWAKAVMASSSNHGQTSMAD